MEKLKGFYRNNRVFVILMGIAMLCLTVIVVVVGVYFINQRSGNLYGNRLIGIEAVPITDQRLVQLQELFTDQDIVERSSTRIRGRIIYINVILNDGRAADAQEMAIESLDFFSEEELAFYDISFIFDKISEEETVFPIMGYKKSTNRLISWTNFSE